MEKLEIKRWIKVKKERIMASGYGKTLTEVFFKNPRTEGTERFIFFDQKNWSVTLAITTEGQVITVWHYYHGWDKVLQTLTGGDADFQNEKPEEVAKRELLEEAGYQTEKIIYLGSAPLSTRSSRTFCSLFLALGCKKERGAKLDEEEEIEVELVPLKKWIIRTLTSVEEVASREATYLALPQLIEFFPELDFNEIFREAKAAKKYI